MTLSVTTRTQVWIAVLWLMWRPGVPSALSTARATSPLFLILLLRSDLRVTFFIVAIVAAVTDWMDGALARRWNCATRFGAMLDVIADKVLCVALMILGLQIWGFTWHLLVPCTILVAYHITVMSLRFFTARRRGSSRVGKTKMLLEVSGLILIFTSFSFGTTFVWVDHVGVGLVSVAAILAVWSMLEYLGFVADWPARFYPRKG